MARSLFAACRTAGESVVKRIQLDSSVQTEIEDLFDAQERQFRSGISVEHPFDGNWKPDEDELLTLDVPPEALILVKAIQENPLSFAPLNLGAFSMEGVKALFIGSVSRGDVKVLIQRFTSQQTLVKRFALFQEGNAFRKLTEPVFSLDTSLTAVIEDGKIKFKSQQKLRSIINMIDHYREATNQEVEEFAGHQLMTVEDVATLQEQADQTCRKLISSILADGLLENFDAKEIRKRAMQTGLKVETKGGKVVMPTDRAGLKALLQFLNESRYAGPLSGNPFVTNSRRAAPK